MFELTATYFAARPAATLPRRIRTTSPTPPASSKTLTLLGVSTRAHNKVSKVSSANVGGTSTPLSEVVEAAKSKGMLAKVGEAVLTDATESDKEGMVGVLTEP